jgi:hypothetical protein
MLHIETLALPETGTAQYRWNQEGHSAPNTFNGLLKWRNVPYIPWGTQPPWENTYPQKIEELYLRSGYFRRITDDKAGQILGEGLLVTGPQAAGAERWLQSVGLGHDTLEALSYDLALLNGCALQVIWNRGYSRVAQVSHTKLAHVRIGKPDATGEVTRYFLAPDWGGLGKRIVFKSTRQNIAELPAYGTSTAPRQLLYTVQYSPITDYYPLPEAESVYEELALGADVVVYQRRYVQNGMTASAILYVPFSPEDTLENGHFSPADQERLNQRREQIRRELTGQLSAGQVAVVFFNPMQTDATGQPLGAPRFEKPIEERNDQKFIEVQRESRQSFLTGLGVVSGELFGIPGSSGFASQSELLLTANELTYNKVIRPKQQVLLRTLKRLLADAGFPSTQLDIANPLPVQRQLTVDMVRAGLFTANEFREAYGYPPLRE